MLNFPCVFCNDSFDEVRNYKRHLQKHHFGNEMYDQSEVEDELDKLTKNKKDHKKFVCGKCDKGYSTKSLLQRHACNDVLQMIDTKATDYDSAVKLREYINQIVDKYDTTKQPINVVINNNNNNNNINIFNININTLSKIDMSDVINDKFIANLYKQISKPLSDMMEINFKILVLETNHTGRKTTDLTRQLGIFEGENKTYVALVKQVLIEKILETFQNTHFSHSNPENNVIYVVSERSYDKFYVRDGSGWKKNGDDVMLSVILNNIYSATLEKIDLMNKPRFKKSINDFYKEKSADLAPEIMTIMRQRAYELRDIIKPLYEATKHMTNDIADRIVNDTSITDYESIIKSKEHVDKLYATATTKKKIYLPLKKKEPAYSTLKQCMYSEKYENWLNELEQHIPNSAFKQFLYSEGYKNWLNELEHTPDFTDEELVRFDKVSDWRRHGITIMDILEHAKTHN